MRWRRRPLEVCFKKVARGNAAISWRALKRVPSKPMRSPSMCENIMWRGRSQPLQPAVKATPISRCLANQPSKTTEPSSRKINAEDNTDE